jgi:hypothetical protein
MSHEAKVTNFGEVIIKDNELIIKGIRVEFNIKDIESDLVYKMWNKTLLTILEEAKQKLERYISNIDKQLQLQNDSDGS